jgi:formamidopyrimidine-DNA glycosylase
MAVHGRHRQPCPACGTAVQRIVRAENEVNYCPRCQTGGQILSDRSLARLLKQDWPRTIEELEKNPALAVRAKLTGSPAAPRPRRRAAHH